jgi:uncharacterized membrane protein
LRGRAAGDKMPPLLKTRRPGSKVQVADVSLEAAPAAEDSRSGRLAAVDIARGIAIGAMVVYHTAYDLSANRLIPDDIVDDIRWRIFARMIAGTFLLLVGIGLVLATRKGFNGKAYLRRLGFIVGGAALVSLGTWWFDAPTFVFFGILHEIAVASVLALPFLWLPAWLTAVAAAAVIAAPWYLANPFFDTPAFWWVGLSTVPPVTVDYVPVLPWFGMVLAGIVVGRLLILYSGPLWRWHPDNRAARWIMTAGRWSLPIYLVHQPLIVGLVSLAVMIVPPSRAVVEGNWTGACHAECETNGRTGEACTAACACMFDALYGTDLFALRSLEAMNGEQSQRWNVIVDRCLTATPLD